VIGHLAIRLSAPRASCTPIATATVLGGRTGHGRHARRDRTSRRARAAATTGSFAAPTPIDSKTAASRTPALRSQDRSRLVAGAAPVAHPPCTRDAGCDDDHHERAGRPGSSPSVGVASTGSLTSLLDEVPTAACPRHAAHAGRQGELRPLRHPAAKPRARRRRVGQRFPESKDPACAITTEAWRFRRRHDVRRGTRVGPRPTALPARQRDPPGASPPATCTRRTVSRSCGGRSVDSRSPSNAPCAPDE